MCTALPFLKKDMIFSNQTPFEHSPFYSDRYISKYRCTLFCHKYCSAERRAFVPRRITSSGSEIHSCSVRARLLTNSSFDLPSYSHPIFSFKMTDPPKRPIVTTGSPMLIASNKTVPVVSRILGITNTSASAYCFCISVKGILPVITTCFFSFEDCWQRADNFSYS